MPHVATVDPPTPGLTASPAPQPWVAPAYGRRALEQLDALTARVEHETLRLTVDRPATDRLALLRRSRECLLTGEPPPERPTPTR